MPSFCRHNRFVQNCPICSREQAAELREVVTPGGVSASSAASLRPRQQGARSDPAARRSTGVRVRRLARRAEDGFHSRLVPGLKSTADAERLAQELAFATRRLHRLREDPPGLYAEVARDGDIEERTWLAFLIAYLGPLDGEDPFAAVRGLRTPWGTAELPELASVVAGPRGSLEPGRGPRTVQAYREWAYRAGSQGAAFTGEPGWPAQRRFARVYERLGLPGLHRDARFDLLLTLGRLGVYELSPGTLALGGENEVTLAAKRALGIGDLLVLERRAAQLADACRVPLEALDLALFNWGRGERATLGLGTDTDVDAEALRSASAALGL